MLPKPSLGSPGAAGNPSKQTSSVPKDPVRMSASEQVWGSGFSPALGSGPPHLGWLSLPLRPSLPYLLCTPGCHPEPRIRPGLGCVWGSPAAGVCPRPRAPRSPPRTPRLLGLQASRRKPPPGPLRLISAPRAGPGGVEGAGGARRHGGPGARVRGPPAGPPAAAAVAAAAAAAAQPGPRRPRDSGRRR